MNTKQLPCILALCLVACGDAQKDEENVDANASESENIDDGGNTSPKLEEVGSSATEVRVDATVEVWAIATDTDGDPLTYAWQDGSGDSSRFADASAARTMWDPSGLDASAHTLTVTVHDGHHDPVSGAVTVAVVAREQPLRITEICYDGVDSDRHEAFVELMGTPRASLDGFSLVAVNGKDGSAYRTITLDGQQIGDDGFFVVVHSDAETGNPTLFAAADMTANVDFQNGPDAVELRHGDNIVDAVGYGFGGEGTPAVDARGGNSLSRDVAGSDTDDNMADFCETSDVTPGAPFAGSCTTDA